MARTQRLTVRLDPEVFEMLQKRAEAELRPWGPGRSGRVAHVARCLIHQALGLEAPEAYAEEVSPRKARKRADRPQEVSGQKEGPGGGGALHQVLQRIAELDREGLSLRQIGDRLTEEGYRTRRGEAEWQATTVRRYLLRLKDGSSSQGS